MAIDPSRVRVSGPLSAFAIGFADKLVQQGYRPRVTCNHMRLLAHLSQWLGSESLGAGDLHVSEVERFLRARRAAGYTNLLSIKAMQPILAFLRGLGVAPLPP
jgi:integrase/recombinase XerD